MLSKSQVSFIKSLHQKKYRREHGIFIVEGVKSINDFLLSGFQFHSIYYTPAAFENLQTPPANIKLFEVNNVEISKISTLQNSPGILALLHTPKEDVLQPSELDTEFNLVLDGIQDPGNLGTIIRTADWFGFKRVICSLDTAEVFNPKTVQASMGSLSRIKVFYADLPGLLAKTKHLIAGAFLDGENIYRTNWPVQGSLVVGNEGNGISDDVAKLVTRRVTIPGHGSAESLNVGVSTAIFCSEIRRNDLSL